MVSPLTRALQTAHLAFLPHYHGPVVVQPLARERVWHSSDLGRTPAELDKEWSAIAPGRYLGALGV